MKRKKKYKNKRQSLSLDELKIEVLKRSFKIKRLRKEKIIVGCIATQNRSRWSVRMNCGYKKKEELEKFYVEPLKSALKSLGDLGSKPDKFRNYIGNCAEQRACNFVMMMDDQHPIAVKDVEFTRAYRVRTAQVRDYCTNCVTVFNLKN